MHEKHLDYNPSCTEPCTSDEKFGEWYTADFVLAIIILIFQLYFIYIEVNQMLYHKLRYLTSFWNLLDIISTILNIATVLVDILDGNEQDANAIACVAVLVLWFRFFYFLRVFSGTAYLVRMILAIIKEMRYFMLALIITIITFTNTFFILGRNSPEGNFTGTNIFRAFIFSYKIALGDFETDGFDTIDAEYTVLAWTLWFLNTVSITIIMLNLVIAIMGDIFGRVQERRKTTMLKEFTAIMRENDFLVSRASIFRDVGYIVVVQPDKTEYFGQTDWDGRVSQTQKYINESSKKHDADIEDMALKIRGLISSNIKAKHKSLKE